MRVLPKGINYTQIPNFIIDDDIPELRGSEIKVVLAICRKTFGYQKKSDRIALTQFENLTGMKRKTVIDAIRSLVEKNIIHKETEKTPYKYSINVHKHLDEKPQNQKNINTDGGSIITPQRVQKVNPSGVQKTNPQNITSKETEKTTSSSDLSDDLLEVINYWNEIFPSTLDPTDPEIIKHVKDSLEIFSVKKIKRAIFIRSNYEWYQKEKSHLIDQPLAFFPFPETIDRDSKRNPKNIFTYAEKNDRIMKGLNKDEDFQIIRMLKDKKDQPKWKLKNTCINIT